MISVIVPVFNAEEYIKKCLCSIQNQRFTDFECICVDDGSIDASESIINQFSESDKRFVYYRQNNLGPSSARNLGLKKSNGEYIVFVDADDSIEEDYLEKLFDGIITNGDDICLSGYKYIGDDSYSYNDYFPINEYSRINYLERLFEHTGGCICGAIFKKSIVDDNRLSFCDKYRMCEDQLFKLNYYLKCNSFYSIDYCGYNYIDNPCGLSSQHDFEKWHQQIDLIREMYLLLVETDYSEYTSRKLLMPKKKNVLIQLAANCGGDFDLLFADKDICELIRDVKTNSLSDVKWILPLKLRNRMILNLIYKERF